MYCMERGKGMPLQQVIQQTIESLVQVNAGRLEELMNCCTDRNYEPSIDRQSCDLPAAAEDLRLLELVLRETRVNLMVLERLHLDRLRKAGAGKELLTGFIDWPQRSGIGKGRMVNYGDN